MAQSHVIFIGGRSGIGKSTAAAALHYLLTELDFRHAYIEGDALDMAHPAPWDLDMEERNLAAMWANYLDAGYERLVYTNTVSILQADGLIAAMGGEVDATLVLLRGSDATAADRLGRREHGASFDLHLERSTGMSKKLDHDAPGNVHRIDTDGLTPTEVAAKILAISGWVLASPASSAQGDEAAGSRGTSGALT